MGRSSFKSRKRRLHYKKRERKPSLFQPGCLVASPVNVPSKANGPTLRSSSSNIPSVNDEKVPTSVEVESSRPLTRGYLQMLEKEKLNNTYFITNKGQMENFINLSIREHRDHNGNCNGDLEMIMVDKRMISNSAIMKCTTCDFINDPHKLYREIESNKRGRKRSSLNLALGASLVGSSIQAAQATEVFLGLGISPGSERNINANVAEAADIIENLADQSMASECEALEGEEGVRVSEDCMYNNPVGGEPSNPYPRGTIKFSHMISHPKGKNKGKHKILSFKITTKNCRKSYFEMRKGRKPLPCPNHPGCTADIGQGEPISREADDIPYHAEKLKNVRVGEVTTDGDCSMGTAIPDAFGPDTKHTHDFRHVGQSMTRCLNNLQWSDGAFGEKLTQKEKQQIKSKFNADLKWRINAEINARVERMSLEMDTDSKEFYDALADSLAEIPRVCIDCVAADCDEDCTDNSEICIGGLHRRHKRNLMGERKLTLSENDIVKMENIILCKRTGIAALQDSTPATSTQVNEATNRAVIKRVPKSVTYSRSLRGRGKRYVLDKNMGSAAAGLIISKAIGHHISKAVEIGWNRVEERQNYLRQHKKIPRVKRERRTKYIVMNQMHRERENNKKKKASTSTDAGEYKKGVELDEPGTSRDSS